MISYIKIDGFKSFNNFETSFRPLTVIAGVNASGKSNLFDALRLLSDLATTDNIKRAFRNYRGELLELFTKYDEDTYADTMSFDVEMLLPRKITDAWGAEKDLKYTRLRYELKIQRFVNDMGMDDLRIIHEKLDSLKAENDLWIKNMPQDKVSLWRPSVSGGRHLPYIYMEEIDGVNTVVVPQDGKSGNKRRIPLSSTASRTVLSSIDSVDFPHILAAKEEMKSWRFLQLNPQELRRPTSKINGEDMVISTTGANMASTLFRLKKEDPYHLTNISLRLHGFLPHFTQVDVIDDVENKQYVLVVYDRDGKRYTSRVLSEGTLRLLALCILSEDSRYQGLLCFEEPENGIHPGRIKAMASLLQDMSTDYEPDSPLRQVLINTHSSAFVDAIYQELDSHLTSILFSHVQTRIMTYNDSRKKLFVSKMTPVNPEKQTEMVFSEQDVKMTIQMLREYLNRTDVESTH